MGLADYIDEHIEQIIAEWENFAATQLPAAARMSRLALRDHAQQILQAIATDLRTPQSREAQTAKSKGLMPAIVGAPETAAQTHAVLRAGSGFDIKQLAAEYRALRASVLRLWIDACDHAPPDFEDMLRFNEAIDQALAESIGHFSDQMERARNLLLGMVGHDLRSPLQAIRATAGHLAALNAGETVSQAAARLIKSGARMQALLDDLVDFNRTNLGLGIYVTPAPIDIGVVVREEVAELRAAYPDQPVVLELEGDLRGLCDAKRLRQVLDNLLRNAATYGTKNGPIKVVVKGDLTTISLEVWNEARVTDQQSLEHVFEPLTRGVPTAPDRAGGSSLGLGLYIARQITEAHGGHINPRSEGTWTVFSVLLPRKKG